MTSDRAPLFDPAIWDPAIETLRVRAAEAKRQVEVPGWNPQPKQARARELVWQVFELLYGGAAGGGKSFFIRSDAVEYALNHPGAHIGIVRRVLKSLKQSHEQGLNEITSGLAKLNRSEMTWSFPNGSVIRFIGLQHEGDEQAYKSVEFDRLYCDEVTELTKTQYEYMLTRMRSSSRHFCPKCEQQGHKVAVICCSNPEGVGFAWVRRRFVTPKPEDLAPGQAQPVPYEPWAPPLHNGKPGPLRVYVPASVYDNPALLASNPGYVTTLEAMPDARKRAALLHGDWTAMDKVEGAQWSLDNIEQNRVQNHPALMRVAVAIDPAGTTGPYSDSTGIIAVGQDARAHGYVLADRSGKYGAAQWARVAISLYDELDANYIVIERNAGAGSDSLLRNLEVEAQAMMREGLIDHMPMVKPVTATRGKAVRAEPIAALYLRNQIHHVGSFADLEEQLTTWLPTSGYSPDRLDALVWGLWSFLPDPKAKPARPKGLKVYR